MRRERYSDEQIGFALRRVEDENRRLKQVVADLTRDMAMLQDVVRRKW